jgi:hypothetical protein
MSRSNIDYASMSAKERISLVEQIHISYPRLNEVMRRISHCHQSSKASAEPINMLVTGETGTGKSTASRRYEQKFKRLETKEGAVVPVLSATIPVPATVKSLVTRLLLNIGDPMADRGTTVSRTLRVEVLLEACDVELIILDEFQHFIDRDSQKVLQTVADWLKNLLNETKVPIVLIGLPYCDQILDSNPQLKRRFSFRISLEPFAWGTLEQQQDFRKFLNALDQKLPFIKRSNLAGQDTAYRLFFATNGVIANVMKIVRRASGLAIERSLEKLDLDLLAEAYDELFAAANPNVNNPFLP